MAYYLSYILNSDNEWGGISNRIPKGLYNTSLALTEHNPPEAPKIIAKVGFFDSSQIELEDRIAPEGETKFYHKTYPITQEQMTTFIHKINQDRWIGAELEKEAQNNQKLYPELNIIKENYRTSPSGSVVERQMAELEKLMFPIMQSEAIRLYRGPSSDATHPSHAGSNIGANKAILAQLDFAFTDPTVLEKITSYGLTFDPLMKQSMSGYLSSHGPVAQIFSFDEGGLGGTNYLETRSWAPTSKKLATQHTANPVVFSHPSKKPLKETVDYSKDDRYVQRRDLGREERDPWDLIDGLTKEEASTLMKFNAGSRDKVVQERFNNLTNVVMKKDPGDKPHCTIL